MRSPESALRTLRAGALATAVITVLACAPGDGDRARPDTAATGAVAGGAAPAPAAPPPGAAAAALALPPPPPARDADQDFLRHMLDHHETIIRTAHGGMVDSAGHAEHGTRQDPVALDAALDAEKNEMLALLDSLYGEKYSPRPAASAAPTAAGGGTPRGGEAAHVAGQGAEAEQFRAGAALVDRFMPRLRRPAIRELAARLRAAQLEHARAVDAPAPAAH